MRPSVNIHFMKIIHRLLFPLILMTANMLHGQNLAERLGYLATDKLLIVNCDDVGMCHSANLAVIEGMEHGLQKIEVFLKGPGSGRETAMRSLQAAGLEIIGVRDVSPQAHNGCRARKRRRV